MAIFSDYYEHALQLAAKLMLGYGHTDVGKRPMEEREAFDPTLPLDSRLILLTTEIWGQTLPGAPPALDTAVVAVYQNYPAGVGESGAWQLAPLSSVANNKGWVATLNPAPPPKWGTELNARLKNWVPEKFGKLWRPRLFEDFDGTGNNGPGAEVPYSHGVGWLFDPQSGIVTLENDPTTLPVPLVLPLWIKGYRYIGPDLATVIAGISGGSSITVEDSVPNVFPNTNNIRFGTGMTVTTIGANHVRVDLASASTWPWPNYQIIMIPADGSPGTPQDFALGAPVTYSDHRTYVFVEGVKFVYGAAKDYIFTNPTTIRFLNNAGRTIMAAGMEVEVFS